MRFRQLMMDTASNPGDYQHLFHLKVPYIALLEPREQLHLLNHYITYCETAVLHRQSEARDLQRALELGYEANRDFVAGAVDLMAHQAQQWQAEVDWTRRLRERLAARIEAGPAGEAAGIGEGGDAPRM